MAVSLPDETVSLYRRFSVYNSPYTAHDRGCGIDLYPETNRGVSPVAGRVVDTRTVGCPDRPYAADEDHLIVIDTGDHFARVLHVDPVVAAGDRVAIGDPLGEMVRSGFFGRWVDNHVHCEFRPPDANPYRASGSLPIAVETPVDPVAWDGTGRVVETGETYAVLDEPSHLDPGRYVSLAGVSDRSSDGSRFDDSPSEPVPLDGGLAHYTGGGRLDRSPDADDEASISLLGTRVGTATGRTVAWEPVDVFVNDRRVTGLSLFASREVGFGVKIVSRPSFSLGQRVRVRIEPSDDPVRLG